jgi:AcrR family transcriptional regulator
MPRPPKPLRKAPKRKKKGSYHHGDLERALVDAALQTIRAEGVHGLTLRSVGAQLGVSRTALYRHFTDKGALLARVALEGFRLFHAALAGGIARAAESSGNPLEEMGRAYVRFAIENQAHYQVMFGGFLEDWSRAPGLPEQAEATFLLLVDAVRGEQLAGGLGAGDPVELAEMFWSVSHGVSTLGVAGQLNQTRAGIEQLALGACRALRRGLSPARADVRIRKA